MFRRKFGVVRKRNSLSMGKICSLILSFLWVFLFSLTDQKHSGYVVEGVNGCLAFVPVIDL